MREKDLLNRKKVLMLQLKLMYLLEDESLEKLGGKKGFEERANEILDEFNWIREELKK